MLLKLMGKKVWNNDDKMAAIKEKITFNEPLTLCNNFVPLRLLLILLWLVVESQRWCLQDSPLSLEGMLSYLSIFIGEEKITCP